MKKFMIIGLLLIMSAGLAAAEERTTFTGTALIYGSGMNTRTATRSFTLRINGTTSDQNAARYLNTLQQEGQRGLMRAFGNEDLGSFSLGGRVGIPLNAVRVEDVDGKKRIPARIPLERWIGFGEIRGGYRSTDYPFSYIELIVDPRTGKGEGTFIAAAQVRFRNKNGQQQVEIEDFGTFPGKLLGVSMRGRMLQ